MRGFAVGAFLCAADLDRVRALRAFCDLEDESIAFTKFVEAYADELIRVEEDILLLTFDLDEAEALIGELFDSSFLHTARIGLDKYQVQCAGVGGRSLLLWISPENDA